MQTARWLVADNAFLRRALCTALLLTPMGLPAQQSTTPAPPAAAAWTQAAPTGGATLDKVRSTGKLTMGYYPGAKPLSFKNANGNPDGYAVALCRGVAAAIKVKLNLPNLATEFVPMDSTALEAVRNGRIDLLCGAEPRLAARSKVSFSIPVFLGGSSVVLRNDAPSALRDLLNGKATNNQPIWRGTPQLQVLNQRKFAVVGGTPSERYLNERKQELAVNSTIVPVPDLQTGLQMVANREVDGLVSDRSVLLDLVHNDPAGKDLSLLGRTYDHTAFSLAMRRNDDDFRLLVDTVLSRLFRSGKIDGVYGKYLGKPDAATRDWFRSMAEPD